MARRRTFGSVRQLPSRTGPGRWQARYVGPDGKPYTARTEANKPLTFTNRKLAVRWLNETDLQIQRGEWKAPGAAPKAEKALTLTEYANDWLRHRELRPSTVQSYRGLLDNVILPELGNLPLTEVDQDAVDDWWHGLPASTPTYRAHAWQVLRAVLRTAHRRKLIAEVPVLERAGRTKPARHLRLLEPEELTKLANELPSQYRLLPLLAAHCAMRFSEVTELRRRDVDLKVQVIKIERGVTRVPGRFVVGDTKTGKVRLMPLPDSLMPALRDHISGLEADDLLFPAAMGGHLHSANFGRMFQRAAAKVGRPDVRVHDLRHFGATYVALAGGTLAEIMDYVGHSTVQAAMIYQHAAADRKRELVKRMDKLINGK